MQKANKFLTDLSIIIFSNVMGVLDAIDEPSQKKEPEVKS